MNIIFEGQPHSLPSYPSGVATKILVPQYITSVFLVCLPPGVVHILVGVPVLGGCGDDLDDGGGSGDSDLSSGILIIISPQTLSYLGIL